jgi:hypothetical protein
VPAVDRLAVLQRPADVQCPFARVREARFRHAPRAPST